LSQERSDRVAIQVLVFRPVEPVVFFTVAAHPRCVLRDSSRAARLQIIVIFRVRQRKKRVDRRDFVLADRFSDLDSRSLKS
jgi:hypothetical protein